MTLSDSGTQTILGFDFGLTRTGVALGNTLTGGARPLLTIETPENAKRFEAIARLIAEWTPARLIVGLPLDGAGADTDISRRVRRFGNQLGGRFGLPVEFVDERHTSAVAEHALKAGRSGKAAVDAAAAALILQAWLDQHS
jgi:putative Holliday junction resolvase